MAARLDGVAAEMAVKGTAPVRVARTGSEVAAKGGAPLRGDATAEIQTLMGFFLARQGQYDTFLLDLGAVTRNVADDTRR